MNMSDKQAEKLAALAERLDVFTPYQEDPQVDEIAINRLGEITLWKNGKWCAEDEPRITFDYLNRIGSALANFANKSFSRESPSLSAFFPTGERLEMTHAPVCPEGMFYLNLRKNTGKAFSHENLAAQGYYASVRHEFSLTMEEKQREFFAQYLTDEEKELWALAQAGEWQTFMKRAVETYQNIVVSGATGSGKTAYCRSLIEMIDPEDRIITVEDTPELPLPNHPNHNRLLYKKDANEKEGATAKEVLHSVMRKTPKRVLLAELRGDETLFYLSGVLNSGHPGGITTTHANSPTAAFSRLALLIMTSDAGKTLDMATILKLLKMTVNVVVQITFDTKAGRRIVPAIYYDPMQRLALLS